MLQKFKYIQSLVLFLFFGAWMLQSISPLLMRQMSQQKSKVMVCSMDGDCDVCANGSKMCSCNHSSEENIVTLCGCNHHENKTKGTISPFPIKALLQSSFDGILLFPGATFVKVKEDHSVVFADDIFHPPRLTA